MTTAGAMLAHDPQAFDAAIERWCQVGTAEFLLAWRLVRAIMAERGFQRSLSSTSPG